MTRFGIVTGAASGIGRAVAQALRAEGAEVLGIDRADGPGLAAIDLSRADAGEAVLAAAGRDADFLVNAAAVFHSGDLDLTDSAAWDRLYAVNLRAPYLLARSLAPGLARRKGAIVNVSSVNAIRNARANLAYDSLKAALDHMTRGLALDLWEKGVRVNAVAPGGTATQGLNDWLTQASHLTDRPDAQAIAAQVQANVFAAPEDIANIVAFLLSPASRWINGAVITADNALHLRAGQG
ncbi:SDR family NAD(P)-dependent oxidoreductase [Neotabrizicola shimadae]|uniref:SDR family oxidoreductase n=1 Tax=Neotabrizicola shimadae TaxID=2807096 RepID=A0A8G0ZRQ9_9RHOB|nr:SDR family oxidoreductase [Neotabrizicola shimadae]QYZ68792.1 SDR family oxidoreductase [Neotabrizicola shimadae]